MLMAGLGGDSMSLSSVLGHIGVDEVNYIISDGCGEDSGHWDAVNNFGLSLFRVDTNDWSGGHLILDI